MSYKNGLVILSFLLAGVFTNNALSQIVVLSSDMQSSYNAFTTLKNRLELEPTFSYARSLGFYNSERDYTNTAGVNVNSSLYFRATYGVSDILEIGAGVSTKLDLLNLGVKLHILGSDKFGLALIGGINSDITTGNRLLSSLDRQYVVGLASHYLFTDDFRLNASIQFQDLRLYEGIDYFFNTEVGYYINENVLGIVGVGSSYYSNSELAESSLFSLYPGFAIERKHVILVFQGQFDLFGENISSSTGVSVSLTQLID